MYHERAGRSRVAELWFRVSSISGHERVPLVPAWWGNRTSSLRPGVAKRSIEIFVRMIPRCL